jgi:GLPGLI family protein
MKKFVVFTAILLFINALIYSQISINLPKITNQNVKWDNNYSFDKSNAFKIEAYSGKNELMQTLNYKIYYQSKGENFLIQLIPKKAGNGTENIIDKKNELVVQIFGAGENAKPYYNASPFKYPSESDLKKLEIIPTEDTKTILGYKCKKYTYTYKKITGEVWLTNEVKMPNDYGIFRASKMAALHNTLSVSGFVMETSIFDAKGGKTVMQTLSLKNTENYKIYLDVVEMNVAINKVNYYTF